MNTEQNQKKNSLLQLARRAPKGSYSAYNMVRKQLEALGLSYDEYEKAVRTLAKIMGV